MTCLPLLEIPLNHTELYHPFYIQKNHLKLEALALRFIKNLGIITKNEVSPFRETLFHFLKFVDRFGKKGKMKINLINLIILIDLINV